MNGEEAIWEKLDTEFDHWVADMKPHVLKLQQRSGKYIKRACRKTLITKFTVTGSNYVY